MKSAAGSRSFSLEPGSLSLSTFVMNSSNSFLIDKFHILVVVSTFSFNAISRSHGRRLRNNFANGCVNKLSRHFFIISLAGVARSSNIEPLRRPKALANINNDDNNNDDDYDDYTS